jgi:3-isopropylmalate/(R)-2-methylmalate dehydratase small subunit
MDAFTRHEGLCASLRRDDVDTDQIIPKQFLKHTDRDGYGEACFFAWRYDDRGEPRSDFELNDRAYRGASILVTGRNFGCGSSREHAVWALLGMGFRAVLAPSFADIFHANALQNGLLPVQLPEEVLGRVLERTVERDGYQVWVDLEAQEVGDESGRIASFSVDPFWRDCLLSGTDPIAMALGQEPAISEFERARPGWLPQTTATEALS